MTVKIASRELKTNLFFNLIKLFLTAFLFLILGILAKIFEFYHLETLVLALLIGGIVWIYTITFKGEVTHLNFKVQAKCKLNVFNHKIIKVIFYAENQKVVLKKSGKETVSTFQKQGIPYIVKIGQDKDNLRKFVLTLSAIS